MRSNRVVVSMKRFIGDAVMTAPLLAAIEQEYGTLHVIGSTAVSQLLDNPANPRIFLPLDIRRKPWQVIQTAFRLRSFHFGAAVIVNHSFRSAITIRLASIPIRIGHATEGRASLLTHPIPYDENAYEAWSMLDLGAPLDVDTTHVQPSLPVRDAEAKMGQELLGGVKIGIQPGASFPAKMLPRHIVIEVCRALQAQNHPVAFLGGPEEAESISSIERELPAPAVNLVGKTDIRGTLGILKNLDLMIGGDTGLMHMAAAVGCPTITAFGPTPAIKWGHYYEPHQVLLAPEGDMTRLEAGVVLEAARKALARSCV